MLLGGQGNISVTANVAPRLMHELCAAAIEGDKVRVSVSDNGKGWPKENRNRLLEPYITTREKGTGLGLAIVAKIIEQHGGKVELADAEPDANGRIGASFVFRLPMNQPKKDDEEDTTGDGSKTARPDDIGQADKQAGGADPEKKPEEPLLQAVESD